MVHFSIKEVDINTLGQAGLFQLYVTGLQRPNTKAPHRIVFELKKEDSDSIPITSVRQDRSADLKVVGDAIEEPMTKEIFDYDKKLTDDELSKMSVLNLSKQKNFEKKEEDTKEKKRLSISQLADFYESKLDIMGRISKSIMLMSKCKRVDLDWDSAVEGTQDTQLHLNYHLSSDNIIKKIELRLSEGRGPTTYGFIEEEKPRLSLIQ